MKRFFLFLLLVLSFIEAFSQEKQLWQGFFSYNEIKDITESSKGFYAAAENAYFNQNPISNEVKTTSTIEGLSGKNISQIYHSDAFKVTILGHYDGLVSVINDEGGKVSNLNFIINKQSIPANKKKINHLMENDGKIYISTDFGIVVYDLNIKEFGDTYYIGPGGSNIEILQTTVFNGSIYAVAKLYGVLKAQLTNSNIVDFSQWAMISPGNWNSIQKTNTGLIGVNNDYGAIFKFVSDVPQLGSYFLEAPIDTRFSNENVIVTTPNYVYVFNEQLVQLVRINNVAATNTNFICATFLNDKIYIGTKTQGVLSTTILNPILFENNTPAGPDRNKTFAINSISNGFWIAYGGYSVDYNPYTFTGYQLTTYNISKYSTTNSWKTIPYSQLFSARSICRVLVNPNNENQVFLSSFYSGLVKMENEIPIKIYNKSNSTLLNIPGQVPDDIRVNGTAFDKSGNLWMNNSLVSKGLHVLKTDGQTQAYLLPCLSAADTNSFGRMAIDKNDTKWITTSYGGLIGFNEKYNNRCITIYEGQDEGNLPTRDIRAVAVDNKNKLWIGTRKGLRILSNVDAFLTQDKLTTTAIIILDNNIASELLYEQYITDIVVDGANNKWIGTAGAGVFYLSADGQKTYNIFTKENSPLPSNDINDIDINPTTGEVYIATDSGIVSFKGIATKASDNLENIIAYPNPVRPEFTGSVVITGLTDKANVKITDIEGNLVHEAISEGGTIEWDTTALGKYKVASGVYMIMVAGQDGVETKVKKIMIVR